MLEGSQEEQLRKLRSTGILNTQQMKEQKFVAAQNSTRSVAFEYLCRNSLRLNSGLDQNSFANLHKCLQETKHALAIVTDVLDFKALKHSINEQKICYEKELNFEFFYFLNFLVHSFSCLCLSNKFSAPMVLYFFNP